MSLFTQRGEKQLVAALRSQLAFALEGAQLTKAVVGKKIKLKTGHKQMEAIEHKGDLCRGELIEMLSRSLSTPIDREDIFRLSRSIDDILDTLRDFVRESHLYRVGDQSRLKPAVKDLITGIHELDNAVASMTAQSTGDARLHALAARKAGGAVCRKYQYEIAHLFDGEMNAKIMKASELVRRLDIAGNNICEAADAIGDGIMKRWK